MKEKAFKEMKDIKFLAISERGWCCVVSGCKSAREWDLCPVKDIRTGVSDLRLAIEV